MRPAAIPDVVSLHAEEAAFLWSQRASAVRAPHYLLKDLARLDDRLAAHIDGLRVNGEPAGDEIRTAAEGGDPGAIFAAAVLAVDGGADHRVAAMVEAGAAEPQSARSVISALGWLPYELVNPLILRLCAGENTTQRRIGIAAAALHRRHPGVALSRALEAPDPLLQARACRAVGELSAGDAANLVKQHLSAADPCVRYWAAWAATLGSADRAAGATLQQIAEQGGRFAEDAAGVAMRRLDPPRAVAWWRQLAAQPGLTRVAIAAAGALGDPEAVSWLIEQMTNPTMARRAGEALSLITGVHIAYDKLEGPTPEGSESGPNEDPAGENVDMDPDDNLDWPDGKRVEAWWSANRNQWPKGTRHLVGKAITTEWLRKVLAFGYQRQRAAAAMELAIRLPGTPLFEVRAPGFRQRQMLGL